MEDNMSSICDEFFQSLSEMRLSRANIFHFQNDTFCTDNYRFQERMEKIKFAIIELIESGFSYVTNIEDGIDILRIMYQYSKWLPIQNIFQEKFAQMIEKFLQEIDDIKNYLLIEKVSKYGYRIAAITTSFVKKQRIQFLYKQLDSCDWLISNNNSKIFEYQLKYKEILSEIDQIIIDQYKKWNENLSASFLMRLKQPLIAKCFHLPGLLETNIDRKLFKIINEGNVWVQLGFIPITIVEKLLNLSRQILNLFGNVEDLILTYNRIITALSSDEHNLFSPFMKKCNKTIKPAFHTLYWDNESSNTIILDYLKQIKYVENLVQNYKVQNKHFIDVCKQISWLKLVQITKINLSEMIEEFEEYRLLSFKKLVSFYNQLLTCVQLEFDSFGYRILKVKRVWTSYVKKIDTLLLQALKCCLQKTLKNVLCNISADPYSELTPITIKLLITIKDEEIVFQPKLSDVETFFYTLKINLFEIVKLIPRLFNQFKMSKDNKEKSYSEELFADNDINEIQRQINVEMKKNIEKVITYTRKWRKYESLWKIGVHEHLENHITAFSDLDPYHVGLACYDAIISDMQFRVATEETVFMFRVSSDEVILEIIRQCKKRLLHLSVVLKQMLHDRLLNISTHIDKEYMTLNNFNYKTNADLIILKSILGESTTIEKEITRIENYNLLLEKFKFVAEPELIAMKNEVHIKWTRYRNTILQCRLKMQKFHDIYL